MFTLEQGCAEALARPAGQPAIEFEGRWLHWGEVRRLAERVRSLLDAGGVPRKAPVALVSRNHPAILGSLLALLAQGRTVRMLYAFQSAEALSRQVADIGPAAVIGMDQDLVEPLPGTLQTLGIAGIRLQGTQAQALCPFRGSHDAGRDAGAPPRIEVLTSGTTGPPKAFSLAYALIERFFLGGPTAGLAEAPPALLFFPLGNITGLYASLPPLLKGQRVVLLERFSVAGWHDHLRRYRPEAGGLPPSGVQMVLEAELPREDFACLKRLGTGAAPLDPDVQRAFEARYGVPILLSYGATEFGGPVTAMTLELHAEWGERKFGSVGRALPGARLRVIDADSGERLPPGRDGVLEVVSPRIGNGWIRTSDLGRIDEDGFVFLLGRADGAILRGGFKILPETIERALMQHPAVSAAAAIGVPDARLGQVPAAALQLKPGAVAPGVAELEAHLRRHLPATHVPVHWRIVDALPRTPSLKVERPALSRLFTAD